MANPFDRHKNKYVVRVAGSYLVVGWLLLQVMDITFARVGLPEWSETLFMLAILFGFFPAVFFAWIADIRSGRSDGAVSSVQELPPEMAFSDTGLPSMAVLPFSNLTGDEQQQYLADGMTDEIVTLLAQLPDIFIISQNSMLEYRDTDRDIREIAQELGVRYILQGGIHQAGQRIRITAHFIEAANGSQLWADKFEGEAESIFDMRDQVSQEIGSILGGEIMRKEIARIKSYNTDNMNAWEYYVQAQDYYYRQSQQHLNETVVHAQMAIDKDPKFAQAWSLLAAALSVLIVTRASEQPEEDTRRCLFGLEQALTLAPDHPRVLAECANVNSNLSRHDRAIQLAHEAADRAPCFAAATSILGLTYLTLGKIEEAVHFIQKSQACSPRDSQMSMWLYWMSWAYTIDGDLESALEYVNRSIERNPEAFLAWISRTNILGQMGRIDEAKTSLVRTRELLPIITMDIVVAATEDFFSTPELAACISKGFVAAGLE